MSEALICDRCGLILTQGNRLKPEIHTFDMWAPTGMDKNRIHLCDGCYELFENEFLSNLIGESDEQMPV